MTAQNVTKNQVSFKQRGRTKMGWIHRSTPTRYLVWFKEDGREKTVWRRKNEVTFVSDGRRRRRRPKNPCPPRPNRSQLAHAADLSKRFHGPPPRYRKRVNLNWPKAVASLGRCMRLDYLSDKFDGKRRVYRHDFGDPPDVYAAPGKQPGGKTMLIVIGKFQLKRAGITG